MIQSVTSVIHVVLAKNKNKTIVVVVFSSRASTLEIFSRWNTVCCLELLRSYDDTLVTFTSLLQYRKKSAVLTVTAHFLTTLIPEVNI